MKKRVITLFTALLLGVAYVGYAQESRNLQYFRSAGKPGVNVFETPKEDTIAFEHINVRVGGDFAIQFQALNQQNNGDSLADLGSNFNLPTANLDIDVQLHDGVRMHLRTYLSARHHQEAWVKGGYIQMDKLDFIRTGFLNGLMNIATIKIGLDEFNYGDAHFRRTDNARAIYNPFVGNYIMDAFSTEVFGEVTLQHSGWLGVVGLTNGKLNQNVVINQNSDNQPSFYGKLGYDDYVSDELRVRLTGSWYINQGTTTGTYLYGGDRGGGRYYKVMQTVSGAGSDFEGRFNPAFKAISAFQINPFVKYQGLEFFGIYEVASNADDQGGGFFTQLAGELLYRFGPDEQLYAGGRYNTVSGEMLEGSPVMNIQRLSLGAGWFLTENILAKFEYVTQTYDGAGWQNTKYAGGKFDGLVIEAVVGF